MTSLRVGKEGREKWRRFVLFLVVVVVVVVVVVCLHRTKT